MRLQSYIIAEGRTKAISEEAAFDLIMDKCGKHINALNSGKRPNIYRGIRSMTSDYGIVDPSTSSERRSAHQSNHTTFLMDNLPSWKGYPKRSQSIVCSTNMASAKSYGVLYHVFPTDKCDIGIVPEIDVWDGFQETLKVDVPQFNRFLQGFNVPDDSWRKMKAGMEYGFNDLPIDEFTQIKNFKMKKGTWNPQAEQMAIKDISKRYAKIGVLPVSVFEDHVIQVLQTHIKGKRQPNILDTLNKVMSPKANGFKLNKLSTSDNDNEIWIGSAPIIMASERMSEELDEMGFIR